MTDDQLRFLRLHQRHLVERTQAIFQGAMVRAVSDRGVTATVRLDELETLLEAGVMTQAHGGAFTVTEQGRGL
jgi:DNA replicative helicase MCM subunit Mcm2 (Cdc46/Mcm family)